MPTSILILVTHLLGVGHLTRAAALGRGLVAAGHRVTLVTGGRPAPLVTMDGIEVVQLPPVHCVGVDFRTLLGNDGLPISAETRARRIDLLLEALGTSDPDAVITETYPFGRRQLAPEFQALVEAARRRSRPTAILSSIRDILNPPAKAVRAMEADAILARFYDGVLVHGDAVVTPLSASWPCGPGLERRLAYTGYIADSGGATAPIPSRDILVSGGGSAASLPLYRAAIGAARQGPAGHPWRILVGHGVRQDEFASLQAEAGANVSVERARPDFPGLLAGAAVSVSQAGYNTMIDLARARVPAVIVPFEQGKEAEQRLRAERFAALGLARLVTEEALSPTALERAVRAALVEPPGEALRLDLGGIAGSVAAIDRAIVKAGRLAQAWARLDEAIASAGRPICLWWRDDDAVRSGPALERLLGLARSHGVPLALAVIPAQATSDLAERLRGEPSIEVLVHGYSHANHASPGRKKQELGYRPAGEILAELALGSARLKDLFGDACRPVLVPPWNRLDSELIGELAGLGFRGLSTFGRRAAPFQEGLAIVNTHCDPIDWRGGGGLADEVTLLQQLADAVGADEPIGILSHHLVHDEWLWSFLDLLLKKLKSHANVVFPDVHALFEA